MLRPCLKTKKYNEACDLGKACSPWFSGLWEGMSHPPQPALGGFPVVGLISHLSDSEEPHLCLTSACRFQAANGTLHICLWFEI